MVTEIKKTKGGAVYEVKGRPYNCVEIDFSRDENKSFTYADMEEIMKNEFPYVKSEGISIFCHSGAGMHIEQRR